MRNGKSLQLLLCLAMAGCVPLPNAATDPFRDLFPVPMDGLPHPLAATIAPLGELAEGQVIRLQVTGDDIASVYILLNDPAVEDAGDIVGGGRPNQFFNYRVQIAGMYFVYVQF